VTKSRKKLRLVSLLIASLVTAAGVWRARASRVPPATAWKCSSQPITAVALFDGDEVWSGDSAGRVLTFQTGPHSVQSSFACGSNIIVAMLGHDARHLYAVSRDGTVSEFFRGASWKITRQVKRPGYMLAACSLGPYLLFLDAAGVIWKADDSLENWPRIAKLTSASDLSSGLLAVAPRSGVFYGGNHNAAISIRIQDNSVLKTVDFGDNDGYLRAAISPDEKLMAFGDWDSASSDSVVLVNCRTGGIVKVINSGNFVNALAFVDNETLAVSEQDRGTYLVKTDGSPDRPSLTRETASSLFAPGHGDLLAGTQDGNVLIWHLKDIAPWASSRFAP